MNIFIDLLKYVFDPTPLAFSNYELLFMILAGLLVVGGIALKFYLKTNREDKPFRRAFRDFPLKLIILGLLLAFYAFLRHNSVAFLSMRALLFANLIAIAYVIYRMVMAYTKDYPALKQHAKNKEEKNKYAPKKRRK